MDPLKDAITKFEKMLKKYPDDPKFTYDFLYFFRNFHRMNHHNHSLPTIELGALLKYHKPNIFYDLKKLSNYNQVIDFITHVDINYHEAKERIDNLKKTL